MNRRFFRFFFNSGTYPARVSVFNVQAMMRCAHNTTGRFIIFFHRRVVVAGGFFFFFVSFLFLYIFFSSFSLLVCSSFVCYVRLCVMALATVKALTCVQIDTMKAANDKTNKKKKQNYRIRSKRKESECDAVFRDGIRKTNE